MITSPANKKSKGMAATIKDIAKKVGVAPSTVSRALNGTAPISDEVKAEIQVAMKELNYHRNSQARGIATGVTDTIGLVINARDEEVFSNSFFNRSVFAIEKSVQENDYNLLITNENNCGGSQIEALIYEKKVDGLIIPPSVLDRRLYRFLQQQKFPFVVLGEPNLAADKISWVDIDNQQGAENAVHHLISQGYLQIVLVSSDLNTIFAQKRYEGYLAAIKDFCPEVLIDGEYDNGLLRKRIVDSVKKYGKTGFLCAGNAMACTALNALHAENIDVPGTAGIVTFDNTPLVTYMDPELTAVDVDTYRLGEEAAALLFRLIRNKKEKGRHEMISTRLIIRASSRRRG